MNGGERWMRMDECSLFKADLSQKGSLFEIPLSQMFSVNENLLCIPDLYFLSTLSATNKPRIVNT